MSTPESDVPAREMGGNPPSRSSRRVLAPAVLSLLRRTRAKDVLDAGAATAHCAGGWPSRVTRRRDATLTKTESRSPAAHPDISFHQIGE